MVAIKNILLFITSVSAFSLFQPRQGAQVYNDLQNINDCANRLTTAVNKYGSGSNGLISSAANGVKDPLTIQKRSAELEHAIVSATQNCKKSPALEEPEAKKVITYYDTTVQKSVYDAQDALKKKKPDFEKAGLLPRVQKTLTRMKDETSAYGNELVKKASTQYKEKAVKSVQEIDGEYEKALQVYGVSAE